MKYVIIYIMDFSKKNLLGNIILMFFMDYFVPMNLD